MATIFDKPANDMEREIANHILPLLTPEVEEKIKKDKLTLQGCLDHCYSKGKKFEVKTGNKGIARISEEQHFKWVREYFGIKGDAALPSSADPVEDKSKSVALDLDFDSLFE